MGIQTQRWKKTINKTKNLTINKFIYIDAFVHLQINFNQIYEKFTKIRGSSKPPFVLN